MIRMLVSVGLALSVSASQVNAEPECSFPMLKVGAVAHAADMHRIVVQQEQMRSRAPNRFVFVDLPGFREAWQALKEGEIDVVLSSGVPIVADYTREEQHPLPPSEKIYVIASILTNSKATNIVVRRDAGFENVKDLVGAHVGVAFGSKD